MRSPVPGLQDATRLAQSVPTGGDDTARVTPTSTNNPMRLMGAQDGGVQGRAPAVPAERGCPWSPTRIADAGYEVAGPERTRFVNQVNGHLDRIERTNPQSAQSPVQQALQIPGNILQMGQDLISTVLSATTPLAYASEESDQAARDAAAQRENTTGPGSQ
jgi:hypothetical protein